jgi:hypothetical protein
MLNDCGPQSFNDNICYVFGMAFTTDVTVRDHRMRLARVLSLYGSASICIRLRRNEAYDRADSKIAHGFGAAAA